MMNLLTRIGWDARVLAQDDAPGAKDALAAQAAELVDYMLFIDEAVTGGVEGTSGFAARFSSQGPRDRHGRSFRDLDLRTRLMRYPLSYMIYSEVFDSLPATARDAIYQRLWQVLSGEDRSSRYTRITADDRRAIREILRDTKPGLPAYFTSCIQAGRAVCRRPCGRRATAEIVRSCAIVASTSALGSRRCSIARVKVSRRFNPCSLSEWPSFAASSDRLSTAIDSS